MSVTAGSEMETNGEKDMQLPVGANVSCTDGAYGKSTYVLINPVIEKVTHLVVRDSAAPHMEYVVPVAMVADANDELIRLKCTRKDMEHMDPFVNTAYITEIMPAPVLPYGYGAGSYLFIPYNTAARKVHASVETQQIPAGELAVRRGTRVEAVDGPVGRVDEFLINPSNGNITHLVMREGHLWGQKDVSIPVSEIRETLADVVYLKLDKAQVEALPTIPLHRP